jgi:hypothetical protein
MTIISGYRWAVGTLASAALTSAYAIESFASQTDMKSGWHWTRPQSRADVLTPALLSAGLDGSQAAYGGWEGLWEFPFWTPDQMSYIYTNLFGSAYSAAQTIRTYDRQFSQWRVLNVTGLWPDNETIQGLTNRGRGFVNFPVRFILGTTAA